MSINQGKTYLNYEQYKSLQSSHKKSMISTNTEQKILLQELNRAEEEAQYYQKLFFETKIINEAIIQAIKRIYSEEIGIQLERIMDNKRGIESLLREQNSEHKSKELTHTFCEIIKSFQSKASSRLIDEKQHLHRERLFSKNNSFGTPKKDLFENNQQKVKRISLSPMNRSYKKNEYLSFQKDSGELSTHRTNTIRTIATELLCQICQKIYPPNEFLLHAEKCKYELSYIATNQSQCDSERDKITHIELNYDKMMRNLLKIRNQIEQQIQFVSFSKEQLDQYHLKVKLETDLKRVKKVIKEKEDEIRKKKKNTLNKSIKNKRDTCGKIRF